MWIVRTPEYANAIVASPWQRIQPQLEKLAPAYPQFQGYLKHQPVPQPGMRGEDFRKTQYALCIAPRTNAVTDRPNLRLFQGLNAVRGVRTGPQRTKNQPNPVSFLSELREIERLAATTVFAIERPLQEIFNNR